MKIKIRDAIDDDLFYCIRVTPWCRYPVVSQMSIQALADAKPLLSHSLYGVAEQMDGLLDQHAEAR